MVVAVLRLTASRGREIRMAPSAMPMDRGEPLQTPGRGSCVEEPIDRTTIRVKSYAMELVSVRCMGVLNDSWRLAVGRNIHKGQGSVHMQSVSRNPVARILQIHRSWGKPGVCRSLAIPCLTNHTHISRKTASSPWWFSRAQRGPADGRTAGLLVGEMERERERER
ncbi:hypothetical protein LX36DRAFT_192762 [Colletotrichum falcatum]|nr:hypothetical protein LX36DRAFT_192762 [Colletotrichum falcatum]